jgi:DNA polymerase III subunit delta'
MDRVLGQPEALDTLNRQLTTGRQHHAYIFHGPVGVGKFTTALAYARVLLCHDRVTDLAGQAAACGSCASCKLLRTPADHTHDDAPADSDSDDSLGLTTAHPDLHVIRKELAKYSDDKQIQKRKLTRIPVEVLREALIGPANLRASLGGGKVFIVDEAELLNPAGQNAMLKTLEEPPPGTTIILVTGHEDRLLPTIRSRCMRVAFSPLPDKAIEDWCEQHAAGLTDTQRRDLVEFASGSLGRAQLITRFDLLAWSDALLPALDRAQRGTPTADLGRQVFSFIDGFANEWVKRHANASKEAANKQGADLMWSLIATRARSRVAELAKQLDPGDPTASEALLSPWLNVIDATEQAQKLLASNVNLSITCDHFAVSITRVLAASA